ncbi:hypothetical protein ALP8811_00714 [Aliiroseovarius pelagivivens]|uniref:Uncharacterized protein n=1 Tax=Aliiroseovarius pelagivivens TaxID=1639690 RepID=A0A2R8AI67_9RHOB|nr:hypothetical protein ALP8811_00714 [Aliiroseovarius pelagivivens]
MRDKAAEVRFVSIVGSPTQSRLSKSPNILCFSILSRDRRHPLGIGEGPR